MKGVVSMIVEAIEKYPLLLTSKNNIPVTQELKKI